MSEIGFSEVVKALQDNSFDQVLTELKAQGLSRELREGTNHVKYRNWFSGIGASFLQLISFLRSSDVPALLELGLPLDLHSACAIGDAAAVEKLLEQDPNGLEGQVDSYYPVQYALGNLDILRLLFERGENSNRPIQKLAWYEWEDAEGPKEWRLMHKVALAGWDSSNDHCISQAELLLEFGADLHVFSTPFGWAPIHVSSIYDGHMMIRWFVEHGVDVDLPTRNNGQNSANTPWFDNSAYLPFDSYEQTPLMLALGEGGRQAVDVLLEAGANVNAVDSSGFTPLHYAAGAYSKEEPELVKLIVKHGASPTAQDAAGRTPLDIAQMKNHQTVVSILSA